MQFLKTFNQKMEKEFDEEFINMTFGYMSMSHSGAKVFINNELEFARLKSFIHTSHTQLLKQFLEGEVERLKSILPKDCNNCRNCINCVDDYTIGLHKSIEDQITHYQNLIKELV